MKVAAVLSTNAVATIGMADLVESAAGGGIAGSDGRRRR